MTTRIRGIPGVLLPLAALLLGGCVTQTTGMAQPEANDADAAELNYQLGARYYRSGNYELARDRLKLSLDLDPDNAIAWSTLALTYEKLENERLATESYERAVREAPSNFDVLNTYAVFLCRQGEYGEARKYFDRAIRIPENDDAYVTMTNAAVCMKQKPDLASAEEYLREALDRRPSYSEALVQLAVLKHQAGDDLSARAFLERYLSVNPRNPGVLLLGIRIEDKLGDDRKRQEYVELLLDEFPESPEAQSVAESR